MEEHHSFSQWISNIIGGGTIVATWVGFIPTVMASIASIVALLWYAIQISESQTARRWLATRRARKLARLKARVLLLEAQSRTALPGPEDGGAAQH